MASILARSYLCESDLIDINMYKQGAQNIYAVFLQKVESYKTGIAFGLGGPRPPRHCTICS